jgi:hypothetical protein
MLEITRRRLLGSAAVGAGGILAQSVLPAGLARAASGSGAPTLSPGQTWVGDDRADYQFIFEQEDPQHPRTQNTTWQGRKCIAFWIYNQDLGPNAHPPADDANPRTQAESARFMQRGGHYIIDQHVYLKRNNLPIWEDGWFNFWEKYGAPHEGSPPLAVTTHDGVTWGFYRGEHPWNTNYEGPIKFDSWQQWTFDFINADSGPLTVSLNGKTVFTDPAYHNINNADRNGPWASISQLYMQRNAIVPDGVRIGPIWMYNVVHRIA